LLSALKEGLNKAPRQKLFALDAAGRRDKSDLLS
jgi:hypothetical protein